MWRLMLIAVMPAEALADSLVATRTIRAQSVIAPEDVSLSETEMPGALTRVEQAVGMEARVSIYSGRPILAADVVPPSVIERNQRVVIGFLRGGLEIRAEGRALARGGVGDVIRVMNLGSRATVSGRIGPDGVVHVGPES